MVVEDFEHARGPDGIRSLRPLLLASSCSTCRRKKYYMGVVVGAEPLTSTFEMTAVSAGARLIRVAFFISSFLSYLEQLFFHPYSSTNMSQFTGACWLSQFTGAARHVSIYRGCLILPVSQLTCAARWWDGHVQLSADQKVVKFPLGKATTLIGEMEDLLCRGKLFSYEEPKKAYLSPSFTFSLTAIAFPKSF